MSESDSSIPKNAGDLAVALEAVRRHVRFGSGLYRPFLSWFRENGPDAKPSARDSRDRLESCLKVAVEFVKAVDTANRTLNAVSVSVLEPLSEFTGGLRWDVRTRRTLRAIQIEASFLKSLSMDPTMLSHLLRSMGEDGFKEMRSRLTGLGGELAERIFDLGCLPPPTYATGSDGNAPPTDEERRPTRSDSDPSMTAKAKRSTENGEGREKLIGALTKYHKYADGSCLNQQPVGNNELANLANVSRSTASAFFYKEFGGHKKYIALCSDLTRLIAALKLLNQEFQPHVLFGDNPPEEAVNPDFKGDRRRKPRASELGRDSD